MYALLYKDRGLCNQDRSRHREIVQRASLTGPYAWSRRVALPLTADVLFADMRTVADTRGLPLAGNRQWSK